MIIGSDLEWTREAIDVLGLAWDNGLRNTATARDSGSLAQYVEVLGRARQIIEAVQGHYGIAAREMHHGQQTRRGPGRVVGRVASPAPQVQPHR